MRCLVTGGGGFLGRYIVEQLLQRGDEVTSFSRGEYPELRALGARTISADIRDADKVSEACRDMDAVFHTAAVPGIWGPWDKYYSINTLGTEHVITACKRHAVPKLVYTSSPSVTFDGEHQRDVDESAPYPKKWLCHYPHSKALAEQRVLEESRQGNLLTCALRPHLIWGPRDPHLVPRLIERARAGQLRIVGDGGNMVDMVFVENAANAHVLAADRLDENSPVNGSAYFISQGAPVNCWEWINEILGLVDVPPISKRISQSAASKVGAVFEAIYSLLRIESEPRMTRFLAAQLATDHYFDLTKAREDFGYDAKVSTEEGMQRLAEWLRE